MTVDFLRSCYSSRFLVNATSNVSVIGRFYRPPKGTPIYTEPTIFRAGTWLDKWDLTDEPGDTLEEFTYDLGTRDFSVVNDLRGTVQAQTGCNQALTLVDGEGGFPIKCRGVAVGDLLLRWSDSGWHNPDTMEDFLQGQRLLPITIPKVSESTWFLDNEDFGFHYQITIQLEATGLVVRMLAIPGLPGLTASAKTTIQLMPGEFQYGPLEMTPAAPWEWMSPSQSLKIILFNFT